MCREIQIQKRMNIERVPKQGCIKVGLVGLHVQKQEELSIDNNLLGKSKLLTTGRSSSHEL